MDTIVYIDGLNFYYGAVRNEPALKWVDFEALAHLLVPHDSVILIRYFTARVKPRYPGDRSNERQNAYLRAIRTNKLIQVEEGHFRSDVKWRAVANLPYRTLFMPTLRPHLVMRAIWTDNRRRQQNGAAMVQVKIFEEKGSDVNLGAWLLHDALAGGGPKAPKAIVITNDSDLATPLRMAKRCGVAIGLVNPHPQPTNNKLRNEASFEIPFRRDVLAKCQLPAVVTDNRKRQIHRPKEWT